MAYVSLARTPERSDRPGITALDRYGAYEVRLIEFVQGAQPDDCRFWLELYCHDTQTSLDSCLCENLEDAEIAADHLILIARSLR